MRLHLAASLFTLYSHGGREKEVSRGRPNIGAGIKKVKEEEKTRSSVRRSQHLPVLQAVETRTSVLLLLLIHEQLPRLLDGSVESNESIDHDRPLMVRDD